MRSLAVARVEVSRNARFPVGEYLYGWFGWQDYCLATESMVWVRVQLKSGPLSSGLGIYGISGLTAVLALGESARPQADEIEAGLDRAPAPLAATFRGENRGKKIIQILDGTQML